MPTSGYEHLPFSGESSQDRLAYDRYLEDVKRGKSALQLTAIAAQLTPDVRNSWLPRSFTGVSTSAGHFDAIVCNVSYHFHKHGQKYRNIRLYTEPGEALLSTTPAYRHAGRQGADSVATRDFRPRGSHPHVLRLTISFEANRSGSDYSRVG